jgi:ABC-2 type transport system permease protein
VAEGTRAGALRAHRVVAGSRLAAQLQYRMSFAFDVAQSVVGTALGFVEVAVVFSNVPVLADLDLRTAVLVYAIATLGFGLANAIVGPLDTIPQFIRSGTLEVFLVRPQSVLAQIVTSEVQLRRVGAPLVGAALLAVAVRITPVPWTPARVALVAVAPLAGAVLFGALFVVAGALQFWLVDAAEVTNAFTYGGNYAAQFSSGVFPGPLRLLLVTAVPVSFAAYLPVAAVLGLPGPPGVPGWLGWCAPLAALAATAAAALLWRAGLRHYTGAGG